MKHLLTGAILALAGCVGYLYLLAAHQQSHIARLHRAQASDYDMAKDAVLRLKVLKNRLDMHDDAHAKMALAKQMHFDSNTIIGPGRRDHSLAR